jgi:hypothetical protein
VQTPSRDDDDDDDDDDDSTNSTEPMKIVTQVPEVPSPQVLSPQYTLHTDNDSNSGDSEDLTSEAQSCKLISGRILS